MSKMFYPKLALNNIKKNAQTYVPYVITCIITIAMFFMILSLSKNPGVDLSLGGYTILYTLELATNITGIFAVIFLFYTNSFLMKRRKKEFGLFNILGMEKRHISKIIFFETLFITLLSIIVGLALGLLLNKLMYLLLFKLIEVPVTSAMPISIDAIWITIAFFAAIFLLILLNGLRQVNFSKPIELLKGGNVGEKEPKAKWILAALGLLCLGAGYYISVTTKDPITALMLFFVAVILVIIGTYLLFTAGSIALLKLLKKNKNYYYKPNHFISVSGMMYRMKQNAVGLANICILSTMVLVMISSTFSLYFGLEDSMAKRYPRDIIITNNLLTEENTNTMKESIQKTLDKTNLKDENIVDYEFLTITAYQNKANFVFEEYNMTTASKIATLFLMTLEQYNQVTNSNETLNNNKVLLKCYSGVYEYNSMTINDKTLEIEKVVDGDIPYGNAVADIASTYYIIVENQNVIDEFDKMVFDYYQTLYPDENPAEFTSYQNGYYAFDLNTTDTELKKDFVNSLENDIEQTTNFHGRVEDRVYGKEEYNSLFGGMLFIGVFLGILFIMATILIIYYKQISEGYDDKERFSIMKKVGMSRREVKQSIRSQVLTVFFLPLITAFVHVAFAYPVIIKILSVLSLKNTDLFLWCTIGSFLIFAIFYAILYSLTARVYYKIVSK